MTYPFEPRIHVETTDDDTIVLTFIGDHDLTQTEATDLALRTALATHRLVVVDLTLAELVDSSFLESVVEAAEAARGTGRQLRVLLPRGGIVRSIVGLSRLDEKLHCVETRSAALA